MLYYFLERKLKNASSSIKDVQSKANARICKALELMNDLPSGYLAKFNFINPKTGDFFDATGNGLTRFDVDDPSAQQLIDESIKITKSYIGVSPDEDYDTLVL